MFPLLPTWNLTGGRARFATMPTMLAAWCIAVSPAPRLVGTRLFEVAGGGFVPPPRPALQLHPPALQPQPPELPPLLEPEPQLQPPPLEEPDGAPDRLSRIGPPGPPFPLPSE